MSSSPENAASRGVGDSQLGCYGSMAEGNPRNPSGTGVAYGRHSLDHLDGDGVDVDRDTLHETQDDRFRSALLYRRTSQPASAATRPRC